MTGFPYQQLILAAGGTDEQVAKLIVEYGLDAVAAAVAAEVASRCDPPALDRPVRVHLDLHHEDERIGYVLTLSGDGVATAAADPARPEVRLTTDLISLVRSLFGPRSFDGDGIRQVHVDLESAATDGTAPPRRFEVAPGQLRSLDRPNPLALAAQAVAAACASRPRDLGDLAIRFGTDKWGAWHWYTRHYDQHFAPLRHDALKLLEIGIGGYADPAAGGGSLRMWKNYFPRALVYGMDIYDKTGIEESRIQTVVGSQADPEFLSRFAEENGPFDIVIDDGSHLNEHVLISFEALFPHVRPGGWYVIEDTQTAYWPQYGGTAGTQAGAGTSIGLVKSLLDGLQYQEASRPRGHQLSYADRHVVGVHSYHNITFIEKGLNAEATAPAWVRRAPVRFFYGDDPAADPTATPGRTA